MKKFSSIAQTAISSDDIPFPQPQNARFTFIDLFAGIGGMRLAFQSLGGRCVFGSEIDERARETYIANFGDVPAGDITKIDANSVPDYDVLVGGFPCQAFSIAGKRGGFNDTLWACNPGKKIYCQIDSMNINDDTYYTISDSLEAFLVNMDKELEEVD